MRSLVAWCAAVVAVNAVRGDEANDPRSLPIERRPVESSSITSIGYHEAGRILELEFHSGAIYRYSDVPAATFGGLMRAQSKGRYFSAHVRGKYQFNRVGASSR